MRSGYLKGAHYWAALMLGCMLLCLPPWATAQEKAKTQDSEKELYFSVRINFGVRGTKPLIWDGEARIDDGKILNVRGVRFGENDALFPKENRWRCSIQRLRGREYAENLKPGVSVREFIEEIMAKGVELDIQGAKESAVTISTAAGNFTFSLSDLVVGRKIDFLQGNLRVELIPRPHKVSKKGQIQNYPAITADYQGNVWLAWVSFLKGKERLLISKFNGRVWTDPYTIDSGKEGYLMPALICRPDGNLWIVWPARDKGDWDLYAREYKNAKGSWSSTIRLTKTPGADVHPAMAADYSSGRIYLCWQGVKEGNAEIFLNMCDEKKGWAKPVKVTDHPGNDWEPAMALNSQGSLLIAWEGFRDGLHKILSKEFVGGQFTPERIIISSKSSVAHACVSSDLNGRFWISWDEAGTDWGFGEQEEDRTISISKFDEIRTQIDYDKVAIAGRRGRYNSRTLGIVCLKGEKLYKPSQRLLNALPSPMKLYSDLPRTIVDPQGRLWIIFHHYVGKVPFYVHNQLMEIWKVYAIYYDGLKWSDPIQMPHNTWRQFSSASVCIDKDGHLWTAYTQDARQTEKREVNLPNISVSSLALPAGERISIPLTPLIGEQTQEAAYTQMGKTLKKARYTTDLGKQRYTLFWGSLHDLHDVRGRMNLDGFVIDSFKYAMDDWGYDFLGLKDYVYRDKGWFTNKNYAWWETQKAIDLFTVQGAFLSFFLKGKSPYLRTPSHSLLKKRPPKGMPILMGVYADSLTKDALVDAIEKRRQYLATDKILLDFWVADHPMGDKFKSADRFPKMEARVIGTGKLKSVEILRNAECIYSTQPNDKEVQFTFVDMGLNPDVPGEYHYFLQAVQENGRMAWSPPACFHYFPGYDD